MTNNSLIVPSDSTERDVVSQRTNEEIERDRVLVARMYVRGKSQHEIMLELNKLYVDRRITPKMIHLDLQAIRQAWLNSALVDFNAAKAKELARLEEMEKEAWDAWERSKDKHIRIEYEIADDQVAFSVDKIADVHRKKKHKVIEATVGDIHYLEMVERAIKMRCEIIGLFEAKKLQIDWKTEALQSGLSEDDIESVKETTVNTILKAIEQAAKDNGMIKPEDIIEAQFGE
jgi:hypothetical protein